MKHAIKWVVKGKVGVIRSLLALKKDVYKALKPIVKATGAAIAAEARRRVPADTGVLKLSVEEGRTGLTSRIGTRHRYGLYVEIGAKIGKRKASRQKPQPWLYPAARLKMAEFHRRTRKALRKAEGKATSRSG